MDYKNPFFLTVLDKGYNSRQIMESLHVSLVQAMDVLKIDSEKRSKYTAMEELINKQVL